MVEPNLVIKDDSGVTVVALQESTVIDAAYIDQIARDLYKLIVKGSAKHLLLDFSKVRLLASLMLGVLLTLKKKSEANKGSLSLCGVREDLKQVFTVTNLDKTFSFFTDQTAALAHFRG